MRATGQQHKAKYHKKIYTRVHDKTQQSQIHSSHADMP